ncbi:MAG: hypothetical protein KBT33_05790 [Prevotellaceae bacterium]|nr:hypothetical protein [Candidatus Minthosoma equi]
MNNEETIIMQPQAANKPTETPKKGEAPKSENKESNGKRVAATAAAGVFGGAAGGAASVAAATILSTQEQEDAVEEVQEEVVAEPVAEAKPASIPEADDVEILEIAEEPDSVEVEELDYSGNNGEDPVVQEPEPQPTPTSNEEVPEVQILGVYERTTEDGVDQELVILTNGEEVAGIVDTTGDGEANILAVDENENGQIEENEVYDISDQHVEMGMFEQQYLAQQQMEQEQQDALAFEASDEPDYDNDVDYTMA